MIRYSAPVMESTFLNCILASPLSFAAVVVSCLLLFLPAGLAGFHTYLVMLNRTTNEHLKSQYARHSRTVKKCNKSFAAQVRRVAQPF